MGDKIQLIMLTLNSMPNSPHSHSVSMIATKGENMFPPDLITSAQPSHSANEPSSHVSNIWKLIQIVHDHMTLPEAQGSSNTYQPGDLILVTTTLPRKVC